jgi:hypothetical protein
MNCRHCQVVRVELARTPFVVVGIAILTQAIGLFLAEYAQAQISYTVVGSDYLQDFDSLPNTPENTSLVASGKEWQDDTASPAAGHVSIPGWYLFHPTDPGAEDGFNGFQRMRIGAGTATTGAFMSFGASSSTERALGSLASNTLEPAGQAQYIALRFTNNTGVTLGQFTLEFDAEQWRDGGNNPAVSQSLTFGYAVTSTAPANIGALTATAVPALTFTSPVFTTTAGAVDGNANFSTLSTTVAGFTWNPGEDLWLRWADTNDANNDHGFGIDNLTVSADVPAEVYSAQSGLSSTGTTWSDGLPPSGGKGYHVISGHTVTLDAAFPGSVLSVENGTVDINSSGSGVAFGAMKIEAGGNLTESVTGDVTIGDTSTSALTLNRNIAFDLDGGSDFRLKATLNGAGNLDFNEASAGSGNDAEVFLDAAAAHTGIIRLNAGKQVNVTESATLSTIEMNSAQSGGNILWMEPKISTNITKLTFNQPGTYTHAVSTVTSGAGVRLQSASTFIANAATTIDLSQTFSREERRFLVSAFQGSGAILAKGTATDPTTPSTANNTTGITLNEFEVGAQGTDPVSGSFEPYSGTITTEDYINVEVRRNLPSARLVVNDKGRLETGAQDIPLPVNAGTTIGDIQVNAGGVLEVGFEQVNYRESDGVPTEGHHVNHLILSNKKGRDGTLSLTAGGTPEIRSTLRMQINGLTKADQYDYIVANGNVSLGGTLDVLINPVSCTANDQNGANPCGTNANPSWSPNDNELFDIIQTQAGLGDYDGNGSIGSEDYELWRSTFGNTVAAGTAADGNGDGEINSADYVIWRKQAAAGAATISGTFDALNIVDPTGAMGGKTFQILYSSSLVQLKVVTPSGSGHGSAVPEPSAMLLAGVMLPALLFGRRRRRLSAR